MWKPVFQHANVVTVEFTMTFAGALFGHGNPLPRDRVPVLEPGGTDIARMGAEFLRNEPREVFRCDATFLDPEKR